MDKNKWISKEISKLIKSGKSREQSVAIAYSMWQSRHEKQAGGYVQGDNFNPMFNPMNYATPSIDQSLQGYPYLDANTLPPQPYMPQTEPTINIDPSQIVAPQQQRQPVQNVMSSQLQQPVVEPNSIEPVQQNAQRAMEAYQNRVTTIPQNNNQIYNPRIINPYGGISLEQSLAYAGQGFGEKDGNKAALGTGLSFLKGARTFMSGLGFGTENKRVDDEARQNIYGTEPLYNSYQQGGTTYSKLTPQQLDDFNAKQAQNGSVMFTQEGADRLFATESKQYQEVQPLNLGKYKGLNYFDVSLRGDEYTVNPTRNNPHNTDTYGGVLKYLQEQNPDAKFARQNYLPPAQRNMQQGGEITNAQYLTGEFIAEEPNPNVEIEAEEFTKNAETGQIQEAVGEKHSKGGVEVNLPNGSKVLSDYTKIGKQNAKKFKEEFDIKIKATDTFAQVMDKVNKKIGLDKTVEKEVDTTEELENQMKSDGQRKTKELNVEYLQEELQKNTQEKQDLKPEQDRAFELIFEEQEKIPKKETPEMKYGGEIKALAKKYGVDMAKVEAIMKEGGVTQEHLEKFQQGGAAKVEVRPGQSKNKYGYFGNVTPEEYEKFVAQNSSWFDFSNFDPTKRGDVTRLQERYNQLTNGNKVRVDGIFGEQTVSLTINDGNGIKNAPSKFSITAPDPKMKIGEITLEEQQVVEKQDEVIKQQVGQQYTNAYMPTDFLLPPNAMQSVFKAQADLGRLSPTKLSAEPNLAAIEAQRQQATEQISYLPEAQRAALIANMLGTTQQSANQAISQTELANQAEAARVQQYNTSTGDKENLLNQQFIQDYEQKVFATQNNTDRDLRQYFSDLNDQNRYNFNYIDRRNLFNQAPYNYKYDGQGLSFDNSPILAPQQQNQFDPEYMKWFNNLTVEQQNAEQKRLTEQYNKSTN